MAPCFYKVKVLQAFDAWWSAVRAAAVALTLSSGDKLGDIYSVKQKKYCWMLVGGSEWLLVENAYLLFFSTV